METPLDALVECIRARWPDVIGIIRFGSGRTEHQRPESDLDLALLPRAPIAPQALWDAAQEVARLAHRDVDLVDLLAASTVMRAQVAAFGDVIYCADETACAEFLAHALADYARLNEERKSILEDVKRRGRILG